MGSTKALLFAGVVALGAATGARAADLPLPPQYVPPPEVVDFGGWYLRGDVGVGIASSPNIRSTFYDQSYAPIDTATAVPSFARDQQHIADSSFVDIGVGYQVNNWLRFDATGEYRTDQHFSTIESYDAGAGFGVPGTGRGYDQYNGSLQSSVFLVNAYADLGTWYGLTPFIGAGVGAAYNRVTSLSDLGVGGPTIVDQAGNVFNGVGNGGFGFAKEHDKFNLAYAAMAGVSYSVSQNLKLELGYRYLNMGDATSGFINCVNSTGCVIEKHRYDLASQDIRLGMRWMISDVAPTPVYYPPEAPIVRKY
ncbi:outer membrane protein [Lichenihabitans psoromatis]|uniref:outer membrane protein n=1 Tax=Lichenihabitans psoromatis TaxID=2528642 RepID=UPI0010385450|nr:opacity family porin [Lichenihabitans psoromatis]